jgi:hypothetical protein
MENSQWRLQATAVCLGILLAWLSLMWTQGQRADTLYNLNALLAGEPFHYGESVSEITPFYNRVIFPLVHRGVSGSLGFLDAGEWYLVLRVLFFTIALWVFAAAAFSLSGGDVRRSLPAACLLTAAVATTFIWPWEEASDALDLLCIVIGCWASCRSRLWVAFAAAIVFAANRESAAFVGVIWWFVATERSRVRRGIEATLMVVVSYAITIGIRYLVNPDAGGGNYFTLLQNGQALLDAIRSGEPFTFLTLALLALGLLVPWVDWSNPVSRRLAAAAGALAVITVFFGLVRETRVFIPSYVLLALAGVVSRPDATLGRH